MHKGRNYPWLDDLWVCENTWWPYWVPRKVFAFFAQPVTDPQWAFITIANQVSSTGVPSLDRRSVRYALAGELGVWDGDLFISNTAAGSPNKILFNLIIRRLGIPNVSNRDSLPTYTGPLNVGQWTQSDVIPPFYNGTPLEGGCRPAVWSEV